MSDDSIHNIITFVVLVVMFSWVPLVNVVCPPGWRRSPKESSTQEKARATSRQEQPPQSVVTHRIIAPQMQPSVKSSVSQKEVIKTCAE